MGDAPRPGDMGPIEQAHAYAEGRGDDIARDVVADLLASHLALARAGEEMPIPSTIQLAWMGGVAGIGAQAILDLFRPIFARFTQERDEAREMALHLRSVEDEREAENDALRQRAERAELELVEARRFHGLAQEEILRERRTAAALRACVAELESRPEPRAIDVSTVVRNTVSMTFRKAGLLDGPMGWEVEGALIDDMTRALRVAMFEARGAPVARVSPEPGADVVEGLCVEYARAAVEQGVKDVSPAGIRAVLTHLAAMGEEAWPTVEEAGLASIACAVAGEGYDVFLRRKGECIDAIYRSRLSPVIGALRARVAELEATLTEVEARAKGWEDTAREATTIGHGARDGLRMCAKELRKVLKRGAP